MNTGKLILALTLMSLTLAGCEPASGSSIFSSSSTPISSPTSSSSSSSSQTASSSGSSSSVSTTTSSSSQPAKMVALEAQDAVGSYTVGETFGSLCDLSVSLVYSDGTKKDLSRKPSSYLMKLTDSSGNSIDANSPFSAVGNYSLTLVLRSDSSIASPTLNFEVKDQVTKVLDTKEDATKNFSYSDVEASCRSNLSLGPTGTEKVLVIPVEFTDYPFASSSYGDQYPDAINRVFNGKGSAETGYWESVASFYAKSSLGQLTLSFEIAPVYATGLSTSDLLSTYGASAQYFASVSMAQKAVDFYAGKYGVGSTKKFDGDNDGYVDAVWLIYSAPDFSKVSYHLPGSDLFWAFCTDDVSSSANFTTPTLHSYGWASLDFMETGTSAPNVDAHTLIHETGHLLSLPDYYSYDINTSVATGPEGGLTMMDLNIGDIDSFSKIALGWANPYVVSEDCTVTIKPNASSGDCILLADHWNGTAFDEYLLFDLQTAIGVNQLDSSASYDYRPAYFSNPGVRLYHVDARLVEYKYLSSTESPQGSEGLTPIQEEGSSDYYLPDEKVANLAQGKLSQYSKDLSVAESQRTPGYAVLNANCPSRSKVTSLPYTANHQLALIGADGVNCEIDDTYASNNSLFHAGDSWSVARKGAPFFSNNKNTLNNGNPLPFVFSVLSCDENSATLQFRKY
jgi:M6 family metalloprotease-like protein